MRNVMKPMVKLSLIATMGATLALGACQPNGGTGPEDWGTKQTVGTGLGAVGGGLLGNQFGKGGGRVAATAVGAVLGGLLGNSIGASLDNADRAQMASAESRAYNAPVGQQITWNNPQSGNSGVIVPVRDGYDRGGAYCREFNQKVTIGGQTQSAYGTACQQPDGSWKIIQQ